MRVMDPLAHDQQQSRAASVGQLIRERRLADLSDEALIWYVDRSERHERAMSQLRYMLAEAVERADRMLAPRDGGPRVGPTV